MRDKTSSDRGISFLDIAAEVAESWVLLLVAPLLTIILTLLTGMWLTSPQYRSQAIVALDQREASLISSARVLDPAIAQSGWREAYPESLSVARGALIDRMAIVPVNDTGFYSISIVADSEDLATGTLDSVITSLIENSVPSDDQRQRLELRLQVLNRSLNNLQSGLEWLNQLHDRTAVGDGQPRYDMDVGDFGNAIVSLVSQISETEQAILSTELALRGSVATSDIIQPPTSPDHPENNRNLATAILIGAATAFVLLTAISTRAGFRHAAADPDSAAKLERIRKAFRLRPKKSSS